MKIKDVLKKENISIIDENISWKDAIYLITKPLIEQGYVESRYPEEIIKNTNEFGPYYVLVEDVAFVHTRPDQGVIDNQIAVLVNHTSVDFKKNDKTAKLFITLAAAGSEEHLEIMAALADLLSDESKINQIINTNSIEEIYQLLIN